MKVDPPLGAYADRPPEGALARSLLVDVVVHTHWDREWYLPRETTLARLQAVMEQVLAQLDSGALPSFLFDGQTVAWQDLMAVAPPELAAGLQGHARAGRLVLGPWYVSADEFLVSGESLLRNLEFGHADAAPFGAAQRVGYLADTFGHVAQMPQVLAQFGIHHAVLWRGADAQHDRFDWHAPDGTVAGTVFLTEGYYLCPLHSPDWKNQLPPLLQRLQARRAAVANGANGANEPAAPLLLPHGGDHLAPSAALPARIAQFNTEQDTYTLRMATLEQHVAAALSAAGERQALHGELRHNTQAFVLPDVLSSRRHLKQAHQQAEDRLLGELEPLWAQLGAQAVAARPAATAALQRAWRTLIQQQAHDSICGCSIDAVHAEMAERFVQLAQLHDAIRHAACVAGGLITAHQHGTAALNVWADDTRCTLFNPLPQARSGWHTVSVFLQGARHGALQLLTADGSALPHQVLAVEEAAELVSPLDDFPERLTGHRYELAVQAALPGLGTLALQVHGLADAASHPGAWTATQTLENAAWQVALADDGTLRLTDRRAGLVMQQALGLLSELDAGDSYNFSPTTVPHCSSTQQWTLLSARRSSAVQEMHLAVALQVPAGLDAQRHGRSPETVTCRGTLRLRLFGDEPALHAQLVWHNTACDQRTRLVLPWLDNSAHSTWSDTAFAWTERPVRLAQIPDTPSRQEMPVVVQPSLSAVVAGPLAVAHRALHEHEVMRLGGRQVLTLTLVRSVGWMSRRDLRTRGVGAGPDMATPGAQCLGTHQADFQLLALQAHEPTHLALSAAAAWRRPALLLRGHSRAWAAPVDIGNSSVQVSSVRRLPDGRLELRLWNPTAQPQPLALAAPDWEAVYADGRPTTAAVARVAPFAIHTLRQRQPATAAPGAPA